jgi:hypothetical protein
MPQKNQFLTALIRLYNAVAVFSGLSDVFWH